MGQQEYDNFKRLIKEWLDSHPDEYADFVEEMNDKKFKGFFNIFNTAVRLVPKYKEACLPCYPYLIFIHVLYLHL